jgi:hypothetical protein
VSATTPINLGVTNILATSVRFIWESGTFTPTSLFTNGESGAWYDPSDLSTLFQDSAGTTPVTADGDPVGLMLDKSGNGNHASQSVSASRPVYRTDGVLHWLSFDGVDDWMQADGFSWLTTGTAKQISGAGYRNTGGPGYLLHSSGDSVSAPGIQYAYVMQTTNNNGFFRFGTDTNVSQSVGLKDIMSSTYDVSLLAASGGVSGEINSLGVQNVIDGIDTLTIGCRTPSNPSVFWEGDLYGVVISESYIPDKLPDLNNYLADKAGVTL